MNVMTFGATCSPYCAPYVKNRNAKEFAGQFLRAAKAIIANHYVDDYLDSVDSEEEAIRLAKEVMHVHAQAGFLIRNFLSNSDKMMAALAERAADVNIKSANLNSADSAEKLLGMWWMSKADQFLFTFETCKIGSEVLLGNTAPTKREVVRALMSVFDPLGLIAHFIVRLKILLQYICELLLIGTRR